MVSMIHGTLSWSSLTVRSGSVGVRLGVAAGRRTRYAVPAARPAAMSRQRSPTMTLCARSRSQRVGRVERASRASASGTRSRRRRHAGRRRPRRARAASCSRRLIASTTRASCRPRAMSGWLVTTISASPALRGARRRPRRPGAARTRPRARREREPVDHDGGVEDAVAIEEDSGAAHGRHPRARRRRASPPSSARSASRERTTGLQPSARISVGASRTTGTSPFQPRSPPVYSNAVPPGRRRAPRAQARRSRVTVM